MKNLLLCLFVAITFLQLGCKPEEEENPYVYGDITVDLDVNKSHVRAQESLLGNMVCDAYKEYAESKGNVADFAICNGGGLRFDEGKHPDGIFPAGQCDSAMVNEIFPWPEVVTVILQATGAEIKSAFERSVSSLPNEFKGWFLQVSKEVKVTFDLSKTAQVIDDVTDPENPVITTEGERVVSVKINGVEIDSATTYKVVVIKYLTDGNDGFVAFKNISADKKTLIYDCADCDMDREAFIYYIKKHTPVTPIIEGRISFN